jgi:hypothetical protein
VFRRRFATSGALNKGYFACFLYHLRLSSTCHLEVVLVQLSGADSLKIDVES